MTKLLLAAALLATGCSALPREDVAPSERGEIKTGTNIHRERDVARGASTGPQTNPIAPSAPPVGFGGARGG
jgi:hypothetical protein